MQPRPTCKVAEPEVGTVPLQTLAVQWQIGALGFERVKTALRRPGVRRARFRRRSSGGRAGAA